MRASLTATTIVLVLSATVVASAQGAGGVQASAPAPVARAAKSSSKTRRRSTARCLTRKAQRHRHAGTDATLRKAARCPKPKSTHKRRSTRKRKAAVTPAPQTLNPGASPILAAILAPVGPSSIGQLTPSRETSEPKKGREEPQEKSEEQEAKEEKSPEEPKEKAKEKAKEEPPPHEEPPHEKHPVESTSQLIGSAALQPSEDITSGGQAEAFQYVALASGEVKSLTLYVNSGYTASAIVVGLYSNAPGPPAHPEKLLTKATIDAPVAGTWNSVNVSPVTVTKGTTYWLAALAPKGTLAVRDLATGGGPTQSSSSESLNSLPSSWSSGESWANSPASFYASGTAVSEPPPKEEPKEKEKAKEEPKEQPKEEPPAAEEPTARFTYSPSAPIAGQQVKFNGSSSTCPAAGPCTYEWSNDGSATRPIPPLFPLGSGETISLTFSSAGTEYMRLVVTDVLGQSATVEHNVTVAPEPSPKEEPKEKEKSKEEPKEKPSEEPKEEPKEKPKEEPKEESSSKTNCIDTPSACGYPDATNTGVPAGTALTQRSGEVTVTSAGTTVKDLAVSGEILVDADNTTLEDDEISVSAGSGNRGIYIAPGVTGTVIDHVTCHGEGSGTQYCAFNKDSSTKIEHSYFYNCGECLNGPGTITESFFDVTAVISGEHYEDIYYGGGEGPLIVEHDTLLNPQGQTATVFASNDFGDQTTLTISDNLLAGGGYTIYGGASCTTSECGAVKGPVTVTDNRFSNKYYPESGYYGVGAYFNAAVTTWSGNFWDNTLKTVPEPTA